jgi:hypothetical protein
LVVVRELSQCQAQCRLCRAEAIVELGIENAAVGVIGGRQGIQPVSVLESPLRSARQLCKDRSELSTVYVQAGVLLERLASRIERTAVPIDELLERHRSPPKLLGAG